MSVGYVKYDSIEGPMREWVFLSEKGYPDRRRSKFVGVFDGVLVFYNDKKDVWGSLVGAIHKHKWTEIYPQEDTSR